jgi:spore coat protein JB
MINSNRAARRDLNNMRRGCGCGCGCGGGNASGADVKKLMRELQLIDFSMIETILYLDAYPCCAEALDYYHKLLAEKGKIEALLSENGYPMVAQNNTSTKEWTWVKGPWPWELDANLL